MLVCVCDTYLSSSLKMLLGISVVHHNSRCLHIKDGIKDRRGLGVERRSMEFKVVFYVQLIKAVSLEKVICRR